MNIYTFFKAISITAIVIIFIRVFWLHMLIVIYIAKFLFYLTMASFLSAVIWMVVIEGYQSGPIDGFGWCFLYFFLTYLGIFVVAYLIGLDIYAYAVDFIRSLLNNR